MDPDHGVGFDAVASAKPKSPRRVSPDPLIAAIGDLLQRSHALALSLLHGFPHQLIVAQKLRLHRIRHATTVAVALVMISRIGLVACGQTSLVFAFVMGFRPLCASGRDQQQRR